MILWKMMLVGVYLAVCWSNRWVDHQIIFAYIHTSNLAGMEMLFNPNDFTCLILLILIISSVFIQPELVHTYT